MPQNIPLAWKQLAHEPMRTFSAVAGIMAAVLLMWSQLGLLVAVQKSATSMHRKIEAGLVVTHPHSTSMTKMQSFSSRALARLLGHPSVKGVHEVYSARGDWKAPGGAPARSILVYGMEPDCPMRLPGLEASRSRLAQPDTVLFDAGSKDVFGPVVPALRKGEPFEAELDHRRVRAVGETAIGTTIEADGHLVTTRANFLRLFPARKPGLIELGLVTLREGADAEQARRECQAIVGPEARVLTKEGFLQFELAYLRANHPVEFIFGAGSAVAFFIGFVIVYQILYTDVSSHLPQFATLKAMGFTDGYLLRIVLGQGVILSILGFIPGTLLAFGVYAVLTSVTNLPIVPTWERGFMLLGLTVLMCVLSGMLAVRKLRSADPADVF
ncbi:MAG: ABC transporter permease DevC [Gemmataceae bacterium]|nr:ABC transporter permease DevC [Gemmataceae bacterium]